MKPRSWLLASLALLVAVLVLGAFPVKAYLDQGKQRDELAARVASLAKQNDDLERQKADLNNPATVEALARQRYQLVKPGEEAYSILPTDPPAVAPVAAPATPAKPKPHGNWVSRTWAKVTSIL